ncbi:MAG: secretin and TonB N-terminal domain-containing protein, partial [Proteobacteria bacterium]|nr:secretin and TonB N-terminal domain-containing protein [Pseudomonadota bacterium]
MKNEKSFTKKLLGLNVVSLKIIVVSAMVSLSFGHVMAQSNLEDIQVQSGANGAVNINFIFDGKAVVPEVFATQVPARIALDFNSTINTSNKRVVPVGIGNAKSIRIVSTENKTRAVIDLFDSGHHDVKVSGNILTMVIKSNFKNFTDTKSDVESLVEFIDFRRGVSGQGIITIRFNNPSSIVNLSETYNKLLIEVSSSKLDSSMDRKMDVVDFATPVTFIDARQSGNNVTIEVEPVGSYTHLAYQTGNEYVLEVNELDTSAEDLTKLLDDEIVYEGNLVSFNFQDIAVRSVIQLIADASQLNIVVADNVTGSVTLRLNNVPWDQALDIVLQSKQLDQRRKGDVIMVETADDIAEREKLKLETQRGKEEL